MFYFVLPFLPSFFNTDSLKAELYVKHVSHRTHGLYGWPSVLTVHRTEPTVALSELHSGHSSVSMEAVYDF